MVLVGFLHRARERGQAWKKGKLPAQRLLMGMEVWQAAEQRSEPANETSPRCLKLQVVSSPTPAAGWSSGAFSTQWNSELVFLFNPLEVWRSDPIHLKSFTTPRRTWFCHLVVLPWSCTPFLWLLWFPPTQTPDWWPFWRTSSYLTSEQPGDGPRRRSTFSNYSWMKAAWCLLLSGLRWRGVSSVLCHQSAATPYFTSNLIRPNYSLL